MPPRLKGRIDRLWRFLAIVIVLLIAVLFYADWRAFRNTTREVEAARALQQQTDALLSSVTDAETGARGYLLTGNPDYLSTYQKAVTDVPQRLDDLARAAAAAHLPPGATQAANATHGKAAVQQISLMRSLVRDKLTELKRTIDVRNEQGSEAALAVMRSDEYRLTMDEVRSAGKLLLTGETLGLYQLQRASQQDANRSRVIVFVGSLGLVILLFRMGWAVDAVVGEREEFARKSEDSRQLLETTLASIGDAVVVMDSAGVIRFMNPVAEKLTGWSMAAARRQPLSTVFRVIDEVSRETLENPFRALQRKDVGDVITERPLLISKDGSERSIEDSSSPIRDDDGNILGVVLVFRDVTARRAAERDLERWKEIFSGAGFGMFVADSVSGEIIDLNPTFAALHGYSVKELLGIRLQALVPEDSVESLNLALQGANENGRNMFEQQHRHRDGTTFPSLVDVTRFQNGSARLLAGYCSDITDRKRFQDALKESEERFRTLANALPQLIWSTDAEGKIEYVNQVWITYAGWKSGDEARQYLHLYPFHDVIHPEDRDAYFTRWQQSLQAGSTFEVQVRLRKAGDGSYRWFLCRAISVRDRDGRVTRWLGGCTDIQQQMEDATQLQIANRALQHSNSDLEQFAYAASHDLQEPLRMVSIYSQLLKEEYGGRLDRQAMSYIDFAVTGAQRMSSLLTALLSYSRVANAMPHTAPRTDSAAAVSAALLNLTTMVKDTCASIEIPQLPTVQVSEVHLVQLFQNLIGNALKYRKDEYPEGERPTVRIEAKRETGGKWLFSVSDNGIGIESEYLTHIFGIFKRLNSSSVDGTGIGLALCQKIVERAGGQIWAESEPGKGSTFFFTLQGVETSDYARAHHNSAGRG